MKKNALPKRERLGKRRLIKNVFDEGCFFRGKFVNLYILKRPRSADFNRAAFFCKRNLHQGKSVLRNRIKRLLREAYRINKRFLPKGHDLVILATTVTKDTELALIANDIKAGFRKTSHK